MKDEVQRLPRRDRLGYLQNAAKRNPRAAHRGLQYPVVEKAGVAQVRHADLDKERGVLREIVPVQANV
jgi:hypothetical protein